MSSLLDLVRDADLRELVFACLDVFLVYYLFYRVLLTIKGTRAAQMVIGIVLIGAVFFAAERFHMATVSWLLDNVMNYFIIIVIVVFQHDIRRALVRLGQNVSRLGRTHEISHALDEVVEAAEHLARVRMGGIVVFEREVSVDEFLDQGERIDAAVSRELLVTLFVPSRDNELHDGAVVVKNLRIDRAGAVLPLSRGKLSSNLGTRHRAAIGITEETDAIAVVVSEERGEISLCFKGNIARDLEPDTLRRALRSLLSSGKASAEVAEEAHAAAEVAKAVAALAGDVGEPVERRRSTSGRPSESMRAATTRSFLEDG